MEERPEMLDRFLGDRDSSGVTRNLQAQRIAPLHDRSGDDVGNRRFGPPSPTLSDLSATSSTSASSYPQSEASSRKTSASSATSVNSSPPGQPLAMLNQQIAAAPYKLPCEFAMITGCQVEFHPSHFRYWLNHSLTHFDSRPPPPKSMCIFCDDDSAVFVNEADPYEAWERRMTHMQEHIDGLEPIEAAKPDFLLINYLLKNKLISKSDYRDAIEFTDRPSCEGLVPNDFVTPEMFAEKERSEREFVDLAKERRQIMRKEKESGKGKGKAAHRSSHKTRTVLEVRTRNER